MTPSGSRNLSSNLVTPSNATFSQMMLMSGASAACNTKLPFVPGFHRLLLLSHSSDRMCTNTVVCLQRLAESTLLQRLICYWACGLHRSCNCRHHMFQMVVGAQCREITRHDISTASRVCYTVWVSIYAYNSATFVKCLQARTSLSTNQVYMIQVMPTLPGVCLKGSLECR